MRSIVFVLAPILFLSGSGFGTGHIGSAPVGPAAADSVSACVIVDGRLTQVAEYDAAFGDSTTGGPLRTEVHPVTSPPYLEGLDWYARDEMVTFEGRRYVRYGRPRVLVPTGLTWVGEFRGVPLFAESRRDAFRFLYALVNQRCEFQPYWFAATVGAVRGI